MHNRISFTPHLLPHKIDNLVEMLMCPPQLLVRFVISDFGLLGFDSRKGIAVASVELGLFAETAKTDGVRVDAVEAGEGGNEGDPADDGKGDAVLFRSCFTEE